MKKVYLFIFIAAFLFATMEVVLKLAGAKMDAFQLTFLRFLIGGIMLLPFALAEIKKRGVTFTVRDYLYLTMLGILCVPISMVFLQLGVMHSNASTAAVLFSINPLFTILFAHFLASERITKSKLVFLLLGLCGIFFIMRPWELQEGNTALGFTYTLSGALAFGLYTVMGKISIEKMGIVAQTSISFFFGAIALLVIILITGKPVIQDVAENIVMVMYLSLFITGLGYYSYFMAIKNSDATTASFVFFIKPVIAPIIAVIVLHDRIVWSTYIGIAVILVASYLNIRDRRKLQRMSAQGGGK